MTYNVFGVTLNPTPLLCSGQTDRQTDSLEHSTTLGVVGNTMQ